MNIRMIGFDLDGTLLTTDKILTERTKKALEAAADQGVDSGTGDGTAIMWTSKGTSGASVYKICSDSQWCQNFGDKNRTSFIRNVNFGRKSARNIGYFLRL